MKIKYPELSIRGKLLLISAVLFVVPWIGVQYIQDMENFLRTNQQDNLLGRAQIVASVLQGEAEVFNSETSVRLDKGADQVKKIFQKNVEYSSHLYVRALKSAIQLDGYLDDWSHYMDRAQQIQSDNPDSIQCKMYAGSYKKYLYLFFEVKDDKVHYRQAKRLSLEKSDHLKIEMTDKKGQRRSYIVTTISPGWVNGYRTEVRENELVAVAPELRIKGEWQETSAGYNIEIRMPLSLIGDNLAFFIADVDDSTSAEIIQLIGTTPSPSEPGTVVIPSAELENMIQRVNSPASRTWLIDQQYRVLAVAGDLQQSKEYSGQPSNDEEVGVFNKVMRAIYQILLKQPTHYFKDDLSSVSYLQGQAIKSALQGKPATSWRDTPDRRVRILTATYPVFRNNQPIGAIAIEETSNSILILQNRAMEILINLSVLTFLITVIMLLSYATRLSVRIRRLRDEAEHAISPEGRISNMIKRPKVKDEIGDLTRSFSDMLSRLGEYNRYLETMAGKLSHELRTPVTVVRSSLENLQSAQTEAARNTYIQRASEGMLRLNDILTRMSEATRIEQTLQSEKLEQLDLCKLVESCSTGYQLAYPEVKFKIKIEAIQNCSISAAPELLAQMLDKLVSNAVDFHQPDTEILICLSDLENEIQLSVINQGESLPEHMRENLFESMVSVRNKRGEVPHLGLGLYIVRMIAEFHQAKVKALNNTGMSGVEIQLLFPK